MLLQVEHERERRRRKLDFAQAVRAAALAGLDDGAQSDWKDFEADLIEKIETP